jgi:hypothetical protein
MIKFTLVLLQTLLKDLKAITIFLTRGTQFGTDHGRLFIANISKKKERHGKRKGIKIRKRSGMDS